MHGLALIYILRDMPGLKQFKIVQEDLRHTRVLLAPEHRLSEAALREIASKFRARLGAEVQVTLEQVDHIPAEASGKFRYVVSRVEAARQEAPTHA
jgi:phenylacetate-CoA ligase